MTMAGTALIFDKGSTLRSDEIASLAEARASLDRLFDELAADVCRVQLMLTALCLIPANQTR